MIIKFDGKKFLMKPEINWKEKLKVESIVKLTVALMQKLIVLELTQVLLLVL